METNELDIFTTYESKARSYCRSYPVILEKAKGSFIYDQHGKRYLDFFSCAGALNYGHNNSVVTEPLIEYLSGDGILMSLDLHTQAKRSFIEDFQNHILKKRHLDYKMQFTSPSGTSVVESAIKLARKVTKREVVVAFTNGFHGMSGTALSVTGNRYHRQNVSYGNVFRIPFDGYLGDQLDTMDYFQNLLEDPSSGLDLPAAVIIETIQGEGGVNVASVPWLRRLRELTSQHGIMLIVDDIQAGCGRSGEFFSFERAGIKPDLVCLSKSLSGSGLPFAMLLLTPEIDEWSPGEDNGTFRGNNLAFVSASAVIKHYWMDEEFQLQLQAKAQQVSNTLNILVQDYPQLFKQVKGIGLFQGIECYCGAFSAAITKSCFELGLLIETSGAHGQVIKLMPALTITKQELQEGLGLLNRAVAATVPSVEYESA
tara:strand:+ start:31 stop:1311 length:1281 start_codon:yes stop_codon:yes gene_type:complete